MLGELDEFGGLVALAADGAVGDILASALLVVVSFGVDEECVVGGAVGMDVGVRGMSSAVVNVGDVTGVRSPTAGLVIDDGPSRCGSSSSSAYSGSISSDPTPSHARPSSQEASHPAPPPARLTTKRLPPR
jgi:hypothetical protein